MSDLKFIVDSSDVVKAAKDVAGLDKSVSKLGTASKASGTQQQVLGKRANRTGVLAQQAGYQFGDFAVQVQSGTNVMVAAGQQATQLIGTFSMLAKSTKAIVAFSALGVLVPIITGIGAALMRTRGEVKSFSEALSETKSLIEEYISLKDNLGGFGEGGFSAVEKAIQGTSSAYRDLIALAKFDAINSIKDSLDALAVSALNTNYVLGEVGEIGNLLEIETQLQGNITVFKENREQANLFRQELIALGEATSLEDQYTAAIGLRDSFLEIVGPMEDMNEEQATFFKGLLESIYKMEVLGAATEAVGDQLDSHIQALSEYNNLVSGITQTQESQLALAQGIAEYGADSVEVAKLRAEQEGISKGLVGDALQDYIDMELIIRDVEANTQASAVAAERFAAALNAAALAGQTLASLKFEFSAGGRSMALYAGRGTTSGRAIEGDLPEGYGDRIRLSSGGGSGGGGRTPFDQEAYLKSLQDEANFKQNLARMTEEQATVEERRSQIIEKLTQDGQALGPVEEQRIQTILKTEAATRSLIASEEERQAKIDMVTGHMESAFMSMVDGSKSVEDAFKGMLRNILLDIYKQQVVTPMAEGIGGLLKGLPFFNANGNAFSGGNVIPFANGGVVSSATMFPMAGNQTGVMGEAGPEAIMPLKRGANGKLGVQVDGNSQGNVVVNQSFNFSANGDDSVKKLIAQAAPQIANMTQKQIMDSRRRGGAMKSTFG